MGYEESARHLTKSDLGQPVYISCIESIEQPLAPVLTQV